MRFRISELLWVMSVSAFASVSLAQASELFESLFFSFTLACGLISVLMAIGRIDGRRAYWLGFAFALVSYLVFAHLPDANQIAPRHYGAEVTTRFLLRSFESIHSDREQSNSSGVPGATFTVDDPFAPAVQGRLSLIQFGGQRILSDGKSMSFMRTGHCAFALLFGWLGGHFTQLIYRRSRK